MTDGTPRTFTWPPKTIVAAVDFGDASARAIGLAGVVAAAGAATLRVMHAERFEVPPYFTPAQIDRLEDERKEATGGDHDRAHALREGRHHLAHDDRRGRRPAARHDSRTRG